ncbi:MAG: AAA family ATPase [Chloroflexi bacterium]|nr:AAA family ATPase [Chloroflexota bacterium]
MAESHPARDIGRVFVGRQREMAELTAALESALSGHGRIVMLVGEPGIGKTRAAQELASLAEQRGAQVLWGRCYEEGGAPPYWPWVQAMRAYVQQASGDQLAAEMGPGAADIAEIVPEIRDKLPGLETPPALEPEQSRFRLFDSITSFLKNAAQRQPLMLVLDDLHWADRSSLLFLEFLAREIGESRLLLAGAYRDIEVSRSHPLSQTLGALVREQLFHRVQLDGLSQQEVGELVEGGAGIALTVEAADIIYKRTDGNPFFVGEVTRQVTLDNITADQAWANVIPEGIRDAIGRRLNRLSERCNEMLATTSIIGREFTLAQLTSVIQDPSPDPALSEAEGSEQAASVDRLLEVVEEALGTGLIEELPEPGGRYQFTHALIQETLLEEISITRRVRLHARIGEALELLYATDVESHAAELARHFSQAEAVLGTEKLVRYSLLAGEQALAAYAWEEGLGHFQRALAARGVALSGLEPATDSETAELLFGLGRAQVGVFPLYRVREAIATLSRAFNYYADAQDVERALAVVGYPINGIGVGRRTERTKMLERAMTLIAPDSKEEGRLLTEYGFALGFQGGDYDGAQAAFNRALAIARREGDAALEMRTLSQTAQINMNQGRTREAQENSLLALELAPRANDPAAEANAHRIAGNYLLMSGDLEPARYHASAVMAPAKRVGDRFSILNAYMLNIRLAMLVGNWVVAREFSDRGMATSPLDARLLYNQAMLEYQIGDFGQGEVYIERLLEVMQITTPGPNLDTVCLALAVSQAAQITGTGERVDLAKMAAEAVLSSTSTTLVVTLVARTAQAILSVLEGDAAAAAEHYTALEPVAGTMLSNNTDIRVDRVLGMLAQAMGNLDQAIEHFEDAAAFCRKAGYRPELAWSCCDYSDTLLQRNAVGDRAKAMSLLDESLTISSELGMRPLRERVEARLAGLEARATRTPEYPSGLSQREVEVLRLIAAGKTDREIAEELFISFRTVGNHVRNILNKTDTVNRTEAATFAAHQGLT